MTAEANNNLDYDETPREPALDYHALNAKLNLVGDDGKLQLDADHEAARQFFLQHVNHNTVYFDDLEKKIDYLITNHYYEREFIEQYDWAFVKDLYKRAYSYKFRFPTFMGAFKYYSSYTLKTFDGKRYLERYEDRVVANALYLGRGNQELATSILDEIMTGRYQPATPTFLNAGKAQRGELVSCFPYDTPIDTIDGQKKIGDVQPGDKVLSHDGRYHAVTDKIVNKNSKNLVSIKHYGHKEPITSTPEHPILIWTTRKQTSLIDGDGADEKNGFVWVEAKNVMPGDFIVSSHPVDVRPVRTIDLMDYIDDPSVTSEGGVIKKRNTDKKYSKKEKYSNRFWAVNRFVSEDYNLGLILGWYLSEGYVSKRESKQGRVPNGVHFTLGRHERDFQNELMEAINNVFGVEAKINDSKYDASTKISVHSSLIGSLLLQMAGTGYNKKALKYDVMSANHSFQHGLLHGLFRGDGHATNGALMLDLVNPSLVDSVHLILSRLGIISRVRTYVNQKGNKTGQVVVPGIAGENESFIYNVNKNIRNYVGLRGGKNNFKNKEFHKYVDGRLVYEVERVETTSDSPETVYNLEVEDTHTYTIRGSVVHNCFLTRVEDNLESISRAITNALQLSKRGGGVALLLTNIRETGAPIKRIENQSSGIVPVMKLLEDSFSYANQLGARQGAGAVYLSAHHPDIMKFLDTKRENADEKIRIKTLSLGVVIPDITFELAKNNDDMYLFSPYDVERVYGTPMSDISITEKYHEMVENPDIRKTKIKARRLFQVISEISMESGYPYLLFEDTATKANPLNGRINMSNLCVSGDTRLLTDKGYRRFDDLYESQEDFMVLSDNRSVNEDFSDATVSLKNSTKMFLTKKDAEVFKVSTKEGFEIKATEWHKFPVEADGRILVKRLCELEVGDHLLVQPKEGVFGPVYDPDVAYDNGSALYWSDSITWGGDKETVQAYVCGAFKVESMSDLFDGSHSVESTNKQILQDIQTLTLNLGLFSTISYTDDDTYLLQVVYDSDFTATVTGVEFYSIEDVYDVTVNDGHTITCNGITTRNCSEILQTNEASEYNPNGSYSHVGKDISCNLGSLNIAKTFDSPDFAKTIETGIRALTSVSDLSNIDAVPSVENGNHSTHSIGLGMMNLHGFLAREHIHYDSPEAVEFAGLFAYAFNYWSIVASNKIAKETGQVFDGFDTSEYANGTYFNKYIEKNWGHITSPKISALLGRSSIYLPTQADWEKLKNDVMEHGLYNGYRLCIPPTGSISYLNYSTASIHPIISPIEIRKEGKLGRVYAPAPYLSDDTLPFYRDAYKIGPEAIINMYAAMTPHIDQGLSLTLFWPDTATTRDMNKAYIYAWRKGIKTIYYARIRQLALEGTQVEGTAAGYCESCQL